MQPEWFKYSPCNRKHVKNTLLFHQKPHHQFAGIPGKESLTWTNFLIGCLALQASITQQQGTTTAHVPSGLINIWTTLAKLILLSPYQKIAHEDCTLTHKSRKKQWELTYKQVFFYPKSFPLRSQQLKFSSVMQYNELIVVWTADNNIYKPK